MAEQNNLKPMDWLKIILILIVTAFAAGLLFGLLGTVFNLPLSMTRAGIPAVVGVLAAFLLMRRKSAIDQQGKS